MKISLKFVMGPTDNKWALVQVMAWLWSGDKPLSEPMLTQFTDAIYAALGGDELIGGIQLFFSNITKFPAFPGHVFIRCEQIFFLSKIFSAIQENLKEVKIVLHVCKYICCASAESICYRES